MDEMVARAVCHAPNASSCHAFSIVLFVEKETRLVAEERPMQYEPETDGYKIATPLLPPFINF